MLNLIEEGLLFTSSVKSIFSTWGVFTANHLSNIERLVSKVNMYYATLIIFLLNDVVKHFFALTVLDLCRKVYYEFGPQIILQRNTLIDIEDVVKNIEYYIPSAHLWNTW